MSLIGNGQLGYEVTGKTWIAFNFFGSQHSGSPCIECIRRLKVSRSSFSIFFVL